MYTSKNTNASILKRLAAAGKITRVLPGVYLNDSEVHSLAGRCSAVAAWDLDAVIRLHAAAALTFWKGTRVDDVSVSTQRRIKASGYHFTQATYDPESIIEEHGLRLTHPLVTALELAPATEGNSIDAVLRSRITTVAELHRAIPLLRGKEGVTAAKRYLRASRDNPWSAAEREGHTLLRRHHLTGWQPNYPVRIRGRRFYLDIAFPDERVAIEIDGFEFHSDRTAFVEDRRRGNLLAVEGWTVLRFAASDVFQHPKMFIEAIRRALSTKTSFKSG